ncbi:family with sequence similarity 3 member D, transcript variant X2 [Ictidomys tridecemlineatus]|uniref:FAM3 metabolism regulating signaling molecule D n=1 Tax=Ictidomys tridecemlineatus TaxID=43179 RepID=A0A287CZV5_ICTTR|nr:protein FAM3D isoform X2 [Ictidomys tridecemlineatus]KAG3279262.1 family with sequence similarity 3 member D, transcript variant X2 [Ictidomys tridecemlineatus]
MRATGLIRLLSLALVLVATWIFLRSSNSFSTKTLRLPRWMGAEDPRNIIETKKTKCGLSKPCPSNYFAFKICSGAANVVGPSMCFENQVIMSPVKNNIGRGLNIALVNGTTGQVLRKDSFDMYSGDANLLVKFLKEIPRDTLVLVASYDDPGTKMNEDIRYLFSNLGSSYVKQLGFRDSWVFLGARDLKNKSPFEQFLKSNPETNKYDGWPELLELEGCVPRKVF